MHTQRCLQCKNETRTQHSTIQPHQHATPRNNSQHHTRTRNNTRHQEHHTTHKHITHTHTSHIAIVIEKRQRKQSFSNTACIFPLFCRELVNGKLKRRHHAARAVSVTWHKKLRRQWPCDLGRWVSQARSRGRVETPADNFPVQSVFTDCYGDVWSMWQRHYERIRRTLQGAVDGLVGAGDTLRVVTRCLHHSK